MSQRVVLVSCIAIGLVVMSGAIYFGINSFAKTDSDVVPMYGDKVTSAVASALPTKKAVTRLTTPEPLKAVYMTSWVASTPSLRNRLIEFIKTTEVNAVIIDIKDDTGKIAFMTNNPKLVKVGSPENRIKDLPGIIEELHKDNIYVIARIAVFQDPYLAQSRPDLAVVRSSDGKVWKDRKGLSWVDAGSHEVWEYIAEVAREAHRLGFDEINFDYIRFPSDGDLSNLQYPHSHLETTTKPEVIKSFFAYLRKELDSLNIPLSADIFGMTTTAVDDMNIGQIFENTLPYFDYVAPMVYPSHYPPNFHGYADPNEVPYEIIKYVMDEAVQRAKLASTSPSKIRPWLQDFDYPVPYSAADVRAQKQATYDAGLSSWMMWDPSNKYTPAAYDAQ